MTEKVIPRIAAGRVGLGLRVCGGIILALGLALAVGGAALLALGGPPMDLLVGLSLTFAGTLLLWCRKSGAWLYLATVIAVTLLSLIEVGFDGWALVPRVGLLLALLAPVGAFWPHAFTRWTGGLVCACGVAGVALLLILVMTPHVLHGGEAHTAIPIQSPETGPDDWVAYGRTSAATRFSPDAQITPANVRNLHAAWIFRTGEMHYAGGIHLFEATPLKVGRFLYVCTPHNVIYALDAASGAERWRYDPHVDPRDEAFDVCRGVSYFEQPDDTRECARRVIEGTVDFRLLAVDAATGRPCTGFGDHGQVDLKAGFGSLPHNFVAVSSPPAVVNGLVVVGHGVMDNQRTDSPSGVVRAYDAVTGELRWAWDSSREDTAPLAPGQTYTLDTPNAWGVFAADAALGLVYVPTGGAPPDYFGGARRPGDEKFGSSIVALDATNGHVRWWFQTVHHDLWDDDIGSQPTLIDFPTPGGPVPALIQATKTGQLYVLDRRDGAPLTAIVERPVPQGPAPGDFTASKQPFSPGMPDMGGMDLTPKDTWGLTPVDRLLCNIEFRASVYKGRFTPPSLKPFIVNPGFAGGMDWGGVAFDSARDILVVNATHLANRNYLVPRAEVERQGSKALGDPGVVWPAVMPAPQEGTPYGIVALPWLSPLGLPCQRPPWGSISGIDLRTRRLLWTRPFGSTYDSGPFGIASHLAAPAGVPNQGGAVVTASGLTFIAATIDAFLRAFDTSTGQEVWRARLPASGQANPISYIIDGRQYVVIVAGGHAVLRSPPGDYVIAFALPALPR